MFLKGSYKLKVLVTGGAGFIGSHIVEQLLGQSIDVVAVDNLATGKLENLPVACKLYRVDIASGDVDDVFRIERPTHVIHQAAQVNVSTSLKNPILDAETNILGTIRVFQAARHYGASKIIFSSSAAVYGEPEYLGIDEQHRVNPLSPYGISKYSAELYLRNLGTAEIPFTILRYANVYGGRQDSAAEGGVVSIFSSKLRTLQSPYIYGDGTQTRDFVYVKDVAAANLAALTRGDNEVVNISTNIPTSVTQLFAEMSSILRVSVEPTYQPPRTGDIVHSYLTNAKAKALLHWEPKFDLASGLEAFLCNSATTH